MLILLVLLGVVAVLFAAAVVATQETDVLAEAPPDDPDVQLPPGRVVAEDLRDLRFSMVLRGYRMSQVDEVLARLESELQERDERIADLETALAEVVEPVVAEAEARQASGSIHEPPAAEPEETEPEETEPEQAEPEKRAPHEPWRPEPSFLDAEPEKPADSVPPAATAAERGLDLAASFALGAPAAEVVLPLPEPEPEPVATRPEAESAGRGAGEDQPDLLGAAPTHAPDLVPRPDVTPEPEPASETADATAGTDAAFGSAIPEPAGGDGWTDVPPGEEPPLDEPPADLEPEDQSVDDPARGTTPGWDAPPQEEPAQDSARTEPVTAFTFSSGEALAVPAPQPEPEAAGDALLAPHEEPDEPEPDVSEQDVSEPEPLAAPAVQPDPDPTGDALLEPGPERADTDDREDPSTGAPAWGASAPPEERGLEDALDFPEVRRADDED